MTSKSTRPATPAQIRHRDRISRCKADLRTATTAAQHARRRRDDETARMWEEHAAGLRRKLEHLTTAAI